MLHPARVGNKVGAIDSSGRLVIEARFESLSPFSDGLAFFEENRLFGIVDSSGRICCSARFREFKRFSCGLAPVKIDAQWGFAGPDGSLAIGSSFTDASAFSCGVAVVTVDAFLRQKYIDASGKYITDAVFPRAGLFFDGLAAVRFEGVERGKCHGYLGLDGKVAIEPQYSLAHRFSEGLAAVSRQRDASIFGFINCQGSEVIAAKWSGADLRFSGGLAAVWEKGLFGYIGRTGVLRIPFRFTFAGHFSDGLAAVTEGEIGRSLLGYINDHGDWAIPPRYKIALPFEGGLASVSEDGNNFIKICTDGTQIWPPMVV